MGLTDQETRFFGFVQSRDRKTVQTGDLVRFLRLTDAQERKVLSRLARRGMIARVRPGLYLLPERIPPGGKWSPSEALALSTLMADRDGRYQISGLNAFARYGWQSQMPNRLFAYNNRISGLRDIGAVQLELAEVADGRLGAVETARSPEGIDLVYSSKARALMDAVYDWSRFATLPRAYDWIRKELAENGGLAVDLVSVCLRYANQGTLRRIGKILEMEGVPGTLLRKLEKALRPSSSYIPLIPTAAKRGATDKRWGVVINDL